MIRLIKKASQTESQNHKEKPKKIATAMILAVIAAVLLIGRAPAQGQSVDCSFNLSVYALLSQSNIQD